MIPDHALFLWLSFLGIIPSGRPSYQPDKYAKLKGGYLFVKLDFKTKLNPGSLTTAYLKKTTPRPLELWGLLKKLSATIIAAGLRISPIFHLYEYR